MTRNAKASLSTRFKKEIRYQLTTGTGVRQPRHLWPMDTRVIDSLLPDGITGDVTVFHPSAGRNNRARMDAIWTGSNSKAAWDNSGYDEAPNGAKLATQFSVFTATVEYRARNRQSGDRKCRVQKQQRAVVSYSAACAKSSHSRFSKSLFILN